jgi:hypothetical protein
MAKYKIMSDKIDLDDVFLIAKCYLDNFIDKPLASIGDRYTLDLSGVTFCTMVGSIALATVISRIISSGISVGVILPVNKSACGYLRSAGMYDLLNVPIRQDSVSLINLEEGRPAYYGKKVYHSKPIYSLDDANQFVKMSNILNWTKNLDRETRESEFFQNGRFARIFSAELSHNIVEHASLIVTDIPGRESFGAIGMRIVRRLKRNDTKWIHESFDKQYEEFVSENLDKGFVEAFICDPGIGLGATLRNSYRLKVSEVKKPITCIADDNEFIKILQYAFDEFGTSKSKQNQWVTDAHALSRILGLVKVYGGILELYSSGYKLVYNLHKKPLEHCDDGLGYKATSVVKADIPFGTYIRILSPLTRPGTLYVNYVGQLSGAITYHGQERKITMISVASEYDNSLLEKPLEFRKRTETICLKHVATDKNTIIVLDFSYCFFWKSDHIATILDMMINVMMRSPVVIVGIDSGIVTEIKLRVYESVERYNIALDNDNYSTDFGEEMPNKFLSNITDFYKPVLSIDIEGGLNWIGAANQRINTGLNILLNDQMSLPNLLNEMNKTTSASQLDMQLLNNTLTSLSEFYFIQNQDKNGTDSVWCTLFDKKIIQTLSNKPLTSHLQRHLYEKDGALWGDGSNDNSVYLLPHSKRYVKTFIEAYRLLQNDIFCDEVGEVLARQLWIALNCEEPTVLITTTAPSVLLAYSMRKWFKGNPLIIDVGHYFDSTKKGVLKSLSTSKTSETVTIVQDIMNTGKNITDIFNSLCEFEITVSSVCCIMEMTDVKEICPGEITSKIFGSTKRLLNFVSLFKVPGPRDATPEELLNGKLFWVEPYSLHPYELQNLKSPEHEYLHDKKSLAQKKHNEALGLLEREDVLRHGHFVFEEHHFSIVTKMILLFEGSALADRIATDIADSCDSKIDETVILVPLHSHIRYLLPKVLDILASRSLKTKVMFAIVTKELGQKPYYMMPIKMDVLMKSRVSELHSGSKISSLNVLIIDDTTATLRTFETMLRALYLSCGRSKKYDDSLLPKLINNIDIWAIVNRTGRAKSTYLYSMKSWLGVPFKFYCYAEYDMPVYDSQHCPICKDLAELERIKNVLRHTVLKSLQLWVDNRIIELQPLIVDSPIFEQLDQKKFPDGCKFIINDIPASTVSLALLLYFEVAERGCPPRYLINYIDQFTNDNNQHLEDNSVIYFREQIFRWLISNTKKIAADASTELFYNLLVKEISVRPEMCMVIAETISSQFNRDLVTDDIFVSIINIIFNEFNSVSVKCIVDSMPINMVAREYLFNSILLSRAIFISHNKHVNFLEKVFDNNIEKLTEKFSFPGDFLGSIKDTMTTAIIFTSEKEPDFMDCLKNVSMELLGSSLKDPKYEVKHSNRIYKHLAELSGINIDVPNRAEATQAFVGSTGFLELRVNILIESIKKVLSHYLKYNRTFVEQLSGVTIKFDQLIYDLQEYESDKSESRLSELKSLSGEIIDSLYSKTSIIFKAISDINVGYVDLLRQIRTISEKRDVHERLKLPKIQNNHTVFADYNELQNFIKNHTVDVLEDNSSASIVVEIVELQDNERIELIITTVDPSHLLYKKICDGHGMRYERWGLTKYDINIHMDYNKLEPSIIKMFCSMLRGYN